jgi:hypothetical protein
MSPSNKPLRQLATEKIHGEGANPTQLGDPVSLKAETSDREPRNNTDENGFPKSVRTPPPSSGGMHEEKKLRNGHHVRGMMTDEIKQGKAPRPTKSLEGDPTSLKAENVGRDPADHNNEGSSGQGKRSSRL